MPSDPTQPEERGREDESPEGEAQRSADRRHYHVTNLPTVEPEVTEDESLLAEEYSDGTSPGRK